jgi:hypothetical protein
MIKLEKRFQIKKLTKAKKKKKKKEWASNMKGKKIKGWNWKRKQIQKLS